jgi:hypothetical protein
LLPPLTPTFTSPRLLHHHDASPTRFPFAHMPWSTDPTGSSGIEGGGLLKSPYSPSKACPDPPDPAANAAAPSRGCKIRGPKKPGTSTTLRLKSSPSPPKDKPLPKSESSQSVEAAWNSVGPVTRSRCPVLSIAQGRRRTIAMEAHTQESFSCTPAHKTALTLFCTSPNSNDYRNLNNHARGRHSPISATFDRMTQPNTDGLTTNHLPTCMANLSRAPQCPVTRYFWTTCTSLDSAGLLIKLTNCPRLNPISTCDTLIDGYALTIDSLYAMLTLANLDSDHS